MSDWCSVHYPVAHLLPPRWQDEFWRLVAERDEARADERDAWDREDFEAVRLAVDHQVHVEDALKKLRVEQRKQS